jgi:3-phosphoshikimate 1-carboxyvinyltransferase
MIVGGAVRVPGDKSITHRALLLGALARGRSHIGGALTSLDARSSARVLRQLGADISPLRPASVVSIAGRRRLRRPEGTLDCGNSGTTTRLLLGLLAGHAFSATLTGDASLRRRPMRRVTVPLARMGARFTEHAGDGLPLTVRGGPLTSLAYEMPVSSAQIKSALLLAGLAGGVEVALREPHGRSRDHTERLLRAFGYRVDEADGWIRFAPTGRLEPFDMQVPGDPSSAAFLVGAAVLAEAGELRIAGVGVNPTRTGFLAVLRRMGAEVDVEETTEHFGEPVADLLVRPAVLRATEVAAGEIPGLIDEIPLLAALASRAEGTTVFRQVGELRVKESDRINTIQQELAQMGVGVETKADALTIRGGTPRPAMFKSHGDHRIALATAVAANAMSGESTVRGWQSVAVSYPRFAADLGALAGGSAA